ncbi:MAG: hypothetical protein K8823_1633 [Cenarchaeum symbiont of Oopsacas minuta]|nr:hypothetical protein [Cenarchaeum symbiont of Oopsacas minuta]
MNPRKQQAKQILATPNMVIQTTQTSFTVRSTTKPDTCYTVSRTGNGLICTCPDHQHRKTDCKHIHVILNIIKQNRGYANNEFKIMERAKLNLCKYCSSGNIRKRGFSIPQSISSFKKCIATFFDHLVYNNSCKSVMRISFRPITNAKIYA